MSEQMLRFSDVNWAEIVDSGESPINFCLQNDVPSYFRVNRDHHRVRYNYQLLGGLGYFIFLFVEKFSIHDPGWEKGRRMLLRACPIEGLNDDLIFLRLDNSSLAEIAISGCSDVSSFSGNGFSIPQPFRVTGYTPHGREIKVYEKITTSALEMVKFDCASLVEKSGRKSALSSIAMEDDFLRVEPDVVVEISKNDLWFASVDVEALKDKAKKNSGLVNYPFTHKERMAGIYWMFQAAYVLNHLEMMPKDKVENWLKLRSKKTPYRYKSIRTAVKFVWPRLDRAKGGANRGDFVLDDLEELGGRKIYEFPFVSKGLSFVLAIADWWIGIAGGKLDLAKKLDENKFSGLEIGDLVYLISGSRIEDEDVLSFYSFKLGRAVSDKELETLIINKKLRPIVDRKLKKRKSI